MGLKGQKVRYTQIVTVCRKTSLEGSQNPLAPGRATQAEINRSLPERMGTVGNPAKSRAIRLSLRSY